MTRLNGATVDPNAELRRDMLLRQYELLGKRGEALLRIAEEGDAVLLSPACASWGMFPNYEVRGQMFKEYVHAL